VALQAYVLASGPSLTPEQIRRVRDQAGLKIAVNSTIFSAPWSDICFALDHHWWQHYHEQVKALPCERWSSSGNCAPFGVQIVKKNRPDEPLIDGVAGNNSGTQAAEFAYLRGADEIILLGVDCKRHNGKAHHHPDHPEPMTNPTRTQHWAADWARFCRLVDVPVINCSPICELDCFEYRDLRAVCGD